MTNLLLKFKCEKDGAHKAYHPQDFNFDIEGHKYNLVTANRPSSGRTSFLQTLGQLIYLHQIGSYLPIPDQAVVLPVFDQILTKFSTQEDYDQMQKSLFYHEVSQLMELLEAVPNMAPKEGSTVSALVLIDDLALSTSTVNTQAMSRTMFQSLTDVKLLDLIQRTAGGAGLRPSSQMPVCFASGHQSWI